MCGEETPLLKRPEGVLQVADLVVLRSSRIDPDERESIIRPSVEPIEHLGVADPEILGAGDTTLDLDEQACAIR